MRIIKKIIVLIVVILLCIGFISMRYASQKDPVEKDIETIKKFASVFENELENFGISKEMIDGAITKIEEYNKEEKYVITFDIQNDTNPILNMTIHLPVKKDFFDNVNIGDVIAEEEIKKVADLIQFDDDLGNWIVIIKNKEIRE